MKIEAKTRLLATGEGLLTKLPHPEGAQIIQDIADYVNLKFENNSDAMGYLKEVVNVAQEEGGRAAKQSANGTLEGVIRNWKAMGGKTLKIIMTGKGGLQLITAANQVNAAGGYYSEMGQEMPEGKIFWSEHNFRDSYLLAWRVADNEKALAILKQLRIRTFKGGNIELKKQNENRVSGLLKSDTYQMLITSNAHDRLSANGNIATHMYLD